MNHKRCSGSVFFMRKCILRTGEKRSIMGTQRKGGGGMRGKRALIWALIVLLCVLPVQSAQAADTATFLDEA